MTHASIQFTTRQKTLPVETWSRVKKGGPMTFKKHIFLQRNTRLKVFGCFSIFYQKYKLRICTFLVLKSLYDRLGIYHINMIKLTVAETFLKSYDNAEVILLLFIKQQTKWLSSYLPWRSMFKMKSESAGCSPIWLSIKISK